MCWKLCLNWFTKAVSRTYTVTNGRTVIPSLQAVSCQQVNAAFQQRLAVNLVPAAWQTNEDIHCNVACIDLLINPDHKPKNKPVCSGSCLYNCSASWPSLPMGCLWCWILAYVCRGGVELNAVNRLLALLSRNLDNDRSAKVKQCHAIIANCSNISTFTSNETLRNATCVTTLQLQ